MKTNMLMSLKVAFLNTQERNAFGNESKKKLKERAPWRQ